MMVIDAQASVAAAAHALNGEGWLQAGELGLALVLSAAIGPERQIRQKNAGCEPTPWSGSARRCSC
jgi:hypothetical protein